MSLFSVFSKEKKFLIHPRKVIIEGEIAGSFYSGRIEMKFFNDLQTIDQYHVLIGKSSANKICLHDFNIKLDENPFSIQIVGKKEGFEIYLDKIYTQNEEAVFGIGADSHATLDIRYVLPNQELTLSANFELPITFISNEINGIFFPLTYPTYNDDKIIQCEDFRFTCKFNTDQFQPNSISSNPDGVFDLQTSTYTVDKLDPTLTNISINYNPNSATNSVSLNNGIAVYCGNYGSVTFIPTTDEVIANDCSYEEFIFMVDCSDFMSGDDIKLASQCLIYFLKSLPENSYFNVILFGSAFSQLFDKSLTFKLY